MNQCDILDELSERKLFQRSRERKVPLRENEVQKTSKKILKNFWKSLDKYKSSVIECKSSPQEHRAEAAVNAV